MTRQSQRPVAAVLTVWLATAITLGATGLLASSPVPLPLVAILLAAVLLLVAGVIPAARTSVRGIGIAPMIAFHLLRVLAGGYFLWLYRRGVLAADFALTAGWGDIIVGIAAAGVLLFGTRRHMLVLAWNTLGLIDILMVLGNAARMFLRDPAQVAVFAELPLSVLPTFVVPIVLATHVLIYTRLLSGDGARSSASAAASSS